MSRQRHQDTLFKVHRALITCASEAPYAVDEKALFQSVCNIPVRSGCFRLAWFGYASENSGRVSEPIAWSGDDGFLADLKLALSQDDYEDPASLCLRSGDACWIKDLDARSLGPFAPLSCASGTLLSFLSR